MKPFGYLFSFDGNRKFAKLSFSDHIKIVLIENQMVSDYHLSWIRDFDDLINCLYPMLLKSFQEGGSSQFETHLKFLMFANVWSDPHVLFSIVSSGLLLEGDGSWNPPMVTSSILSTWGEWIKKTTNIKSIGLKKKLTSIISDIQPLSGVVDQTLLKKLSSIQIEFNSTSTPWKVSSEMLKNNMFKRLEPLFRQYAGDILNGTGLESSIATFLEEGDLKYGWYFKDPNAINNIDQRIIADILINRTWKLDQYKRTPKLHKKIIFEDLSSRYDEAIGFLGNYMKGTKLQTKHYLEYISFWNRLDYVHKLFQFGIEKKQFKTSIDSSISAEELSHMYTLLSLLCFVTDEWLSPLAHIITGIDKIGSLENGEPISGRTKLETAWVIIHGILTLGIENPKFTGTRMSRYQYEFTQRIIETISKWGWQQWFLKTPDLTLTVDAHKTGNWVGMDISYIPTILFPDVFSIFLEDTFNAQSPKASGIVTQFNRIYNEKDIGDIIAKRLEQINLSKRNKRYQFPTSIQGSQTIRTHMTDIYYQLQIMTFIMQDVLRLLTFECDNIVGGTILEGKVTQMVSLITTIHLPDQTDTNFIVYSDKRLKDIAQDTSTMTDLLWGLNKITPQVVLIREGKTAFKLTNTDSFEQLVLILNKNEFSSKTGGEFVEIYNKLAADARIWEEEPSLVGASIDLTKLYSILWFVGRVLQELTAGILKKWAVIRSSIQTTIGISRNMKRLRKVMKPLDVHFDALSIYFSNLKLCVYKNEKNTSKVYETSFNTRNSLIGFLPYFKSTDQIPFTTYQSRK